jgi:hypothetical protein
MTEPNSVKPEIGPEEECPGEPSKTKSQPSKHARKDRKQNWEAIAKAYIYGEKDIDAPATAMPSFPTFEQLAIRFKLPLGTVKSRISRGIGQLQKLLADSPPVWQLLLVMSVTPAICEELAFRGFILSGLRRIGHKWGAIVLTSVFFVQP